MSKFLTAVIIIAVSGCFLSTCHLHRIAIALERIVNGVTQQK